MWTKTSVDASNATASQIYSLEEAQEILAMQDKALMRNPKEYELTDDLHFADPKSGFQTAVPLLQPEEATLIAIANNLEKQIENFEKAIDVVADAINTHATEQDAIEKA